MGPDVVEAGPPPCRAVTKGTGTREAEGLRTGEESWAWGAFEDHGRHRGAGSEEVVLMIKEIIKDFVLLFLSSVCGGGRGGGGGGGGGPGGGGCPCCRDKLCRCLGQILRVSDEISNLSFLPTDGWLTRSLLPSPPDLPPPTSRLLTNAELAQFEFPGAAGPDLGLLPEVPLPGLQVGLHSRPASGSHELGRTVEGIVTVSAVVDTIQTVGRGEGSFDSVLPGSGLDGFLPDWGRGGQVGLHHHPVPALLRTGPGSEPV